MSEFNEQALLAAIAKRGVEPDWKAEYATLYGMYEHALDEIAKEAGPPFAAELAELRRLTGDKVSLHIEYSSDAKYPTTYKFYQLGEGYTREHHSFESARIELLGKVADYEGATDAQLEEAAAIVAAAEEATSDA